MGDNSMRTRSQVQACLEFLDKERVSVPPISETEATQEARKASIRVLKWILKEEQDDNC